MADDWARWAGQYRLSTGKSLAALPVDQLYEVGVALIVSVAGMHADEWESIDKALESLDPPEKVEQTRREDGMLEYNPEMEVPDWGYGEDPTEMPGMPPPASAAGEGAVDGFDPT